MSDAFLSDIRMVFEWCFAEQLETVRIWHAEDELWEYKDQGPPEVDLFKQLVIAQHLINFKLWHVEDAARRRDVEPELIMECKRKIDNLNQKRNDLIEQVDTALIQILEPHLPEADDKYNTETPGSALDRLSILSLKMFHMKEQVEREDADEDLRKECADKLSMLEQQHDVLSRSVLDLIEDFLAGRKRPRVYYQFKMYNDPRLNPQLYEK